MVRPWHGGRRIAFVPVSDSQIDLTLPNDFVGHVRSRAFFDFDPASGTDQSLQAYVRTVSSGRAHIDGDVLPPVVSSGPDTMGAALDSLPPNHSYGYVVAVLPHSAGPHRGGFAWWDAPERNGVSDFARVALYADPGFATRQNIGVWAMEVLHAVTHFGDLYNVSPQPGRYDVMACSCGTHPSSHTKLAMGWLHAGAVRSHAVGSSRVHTLHAISLAQPPPPGRVTAVRVKAQKSPGSFLMEARLKTDVYENPGAVSAGVPSEGVVVYEVLGTTELYLRASGLGVGDTFSDPDEELTVRVTAAVDGGFTVAVRSRASGRCRQLQTQIEALRASIEFETDIQRRKQLISALVRALNEYRTLNCVLPVAPPVLAVSELFAPPRDRGELRHDGEAEYRSAPDHASSEHGTSE